MSGPKRIRLIGLLCAVASVGAVFEAPALAQDAFNSAYAAPEDANGLDQLVAPVALYPDALLAQVLVAATYPADVVGAAQWIDAGNNPAGIDSQNWDDSVKGVARFPEILHYMAANGDWMNDLGSAFLNQQADVMNAVQAERGRAYAAGNLVSNQDQTVLVAGNIIQIIPTDPATLYVPEYDPQVVYVDRPRIVGQLWSPPIRFGGGIRVGTWLRHDLDWDDHTVYLGDWGSDRPWWHGDRNSRDIHVYENDRPGHYDARSFHGAPAEHIEVRNGFAASDRWGHDSRKPVPARPAHVDARPDQRPGTGYPRAAEAPRQTPVREAPVRQTPAREAPVREAPVRQAPARQVPDRQAPAREVPVREPAARQVPVQQERPGAVTARESQRGQQSRQAAAPQPVRQAPVAQAPRAQTPARTEARPAPAPSPAARSSAPVRGGAMGGYQSGADASHSASRGEASRGAAGAGNRGH